MSYTEIFHEFYFLFASKSGIWKVKSEKQRDPSTIYIEVIIILN